MKPLIGSRTAHAPRGRGRFRSAANCVDCLACFRLRVDPMKQARFTFAAIITTCLAWGCTTAPTASSRGEPSATMSGSDTVRAAGQRPPLAVPLVPAVNPEDPNLEPGLAALQASLHARYPATRFRQITPTPATGIYEVVMGDKIAYTDQTGRYFLFGHLFDMISQQDLTVPDEQALQKVAFPSDALANAFVEVHGTGARKLAIFDDPDCPYCLSLEPELAKLKNVTIYRFLYPLEAIHPRARAHSISIWCADDRLSTWRAWMKVPGTPSSGSPQLGARGTDKQAPSTRIEPPLRSCANPIDANISLAASMGVAGTPTLISEDGRVMPGAASAEAIDQWLGAK
ncbi:DsbC family protein [Burkholderia glumae]|nr:DsbC family protein [Burkholderia glumae]